MPTSLVVVESPAKARTIAGYLREAGTDAAVQASVGHVRDLPSKASELPDGLRDSHGRLAGIDPDDHFRAYYRILPGKQQVIRDLRAALRGADELILATDEDREGEAIAWHLAEVLKPQVPVRRIVFHEITPHAIREALAAPRAIDMRLVEAQEARRILDRLVGYETSPILWRKISTDARSAGRVQSVALRLVVDRERERMAFRTTDYAEVTGRFAAEQEEAPARLVDVDGVRIARRDDFDSATGALPGGSALRHLQAAEAEDLAGRLEGVAARVDSVESRPFREQPRAPFTTSTLQQAAGGQLRFATARTMAVAQRLYDRGFITYMRTDSTNLSEQAVTASRAAIRERFGDRYLPAQPRAYRGKVKNAQEAHEAIRPAGDRIRSPEEVGRQLDADEQRLYELIWIRTVACQMADATGRTVEVRISATSAASERCGFRAAGKVYDFDGWRRAYHEDVEEQVADGDDDAAARLPALVEGQALALRRCEVQAKTTTPPQRYSEPRLVRELERRGIGRPSTYAATIATLLDREYVRKVGSALVPTWLAFAVTQLLERHFAHLVDYDFTATMEEALDVVARGEGEAEKWLHAFYFGNGSAGLRELVSDENLARIDPREVSTVPLGRDREGRSVVVRVGRYGPYVQVGDDGDAAAGERASTANLPDDLAPDELTVERALVLVAEQAAGPTALGADPATGLAVYALVGRYGPYVQLGEQEPGSKAKPKRASLFASMDPATVTLDDALALLALPRVVGVDAEGEEITAQNGRFGPYLKRGADTRSLATEEQILTVTLDDALALFAQPKRRRGQGAPKPPLAVLGAHPDGGAEIRLLEGRYGPYVTDGTTNASVPRGTDPATLTLDAAVSLLRARAEQGPARGRGAKKPAKKKAAKKPAKKAAKKPVKKAAKEPAKEPEATEPARAAEQRAEPQAPE